MNIFRQELKANRKALIIWSVCMFLLVVIGMAKYSSYSSDGQSINSVMANMPYSLKALFGMGSFDLSTVKGYFAVLFGYLELAVALHAVLLGTGIIAKEERDKTTEFLMVKPVSRTMVITAKLSAAIANVIILNLVSLVSSLAIVAAYNKGENVSDIILSTIFSMFVVQLIFLSFGMALSTIIKNSKSSGSVAAGVLVAAFVISRVTDLTNKLDGLNLLSPFKYFNLNDLISGKGFHVGFVILALVEIAAFYSATYAFYKRRELNI